MIKSAFPMIQTSQPAPTMGACYGCARPSMSGLGSVGCSGCANSGKCSKQAGMGFALQDATAGPLAFLGTLDWKTWALIIAVVFIIAQNVFFKPENVVARRARRQQVKAINRRYRSELQKVREAE